MRYLVSNDLNVFANLATEDYLMSQAPVAPPTLFLWRTRPAVVIGKHQNPWRECRLHELRKRGAELARRISGGGAVYHDEENLNYAFLCRRSAYHQDAVFDTVLAALANLGIAAHRLGKSSLAVDGRKFSGSAFCYRREAVLHHGTLLLDSDLNALNGILKGVDTTYATHAVASEPASVMNLRECNPDLSLETLGESLVRSFAAYLSQTVEPFDIQADRSWIDARAAEMQSVAWRYDRTPAFAVTLETEPPHLELAVRGGRIEQVTVLPPGKGASIPDGIRSGLIGKRLGDESVTAALRRNPQTVCQSLANRLAEFEHA